MPAFDGVTRRVVYNMQTVVLERDAYRDGEHRYNAGFMGYAKLSGFVIKPQRHGIQKRGYGKCYAGGPSTAVETLNNFPGRRNIVASLAGRDRLRAGFRHGEKDEIAT